MIKKQINKNGTETTTVVFGQGTVGLGVYTVDGKFGGIALAELKDNHVPREPIGNDTPRTGNKVLIYLGTKQAINHMRQILDEAERHLDSQTQQTTK